jgi:DNA-binding IclR family transcriptional regulator
MRPAKPPGESTSGPDRTLRVLERIAVSVEPPSLTELGQQLGIAKSTLSLLLSDLRGLGYVSVLQRGYIPGPRLLTLGYQLAPRAAFESKLRVRLRPLLEALVAATSETAVLSVEVGGSSERAGVVLAVDQVESPNPLRFVPGIGQAQPMYRGAAGRVFLAFSGRSAASLPKGSLVKMTDKTLVDPAAIDAELRRVRAQGFAVQADETIEGVVTIAAPLLGPDSWPLAAVSVFGPTQRLPRPQDTVWPHLRRMMRQAASSPELLPALLAEMPTR